MKIKVYVDGRKPKADGTKNVYLRFKPDGGSAFFLSTGISCKEEPESFMFPASEPNSQAKSFRLMKLYTECQDYVYHTSGKTIERMKADLSAIISGKPKVKVTVSDMFAKYGENKYEGTRLMLERTLKKIISFDHKADFDKINRDWLERFSAWLSADGANVNGIAHHMRNLRAVINYAIEEGVTVNYPFRKYKIRQEQTRKRDLTLEQLRTLKDYPCYKTHEMYRDIFMLIFYLCGINIGDLLMLRPEDMKNGRIEYYRRKTKKYYSIKVEPEALAIIEKYRGINHLISPLDTNKDYKTWLKHMTEHLRHIGMDCRVGAKPTGEALFPDITSYWARHTWASIAAEVDVPMDVIAQALGHATPYTTTDIYVNRRLKKIDEANRKIIDYINNV